jgi:hypothetical protein
MKGATAPKTAPTSLSAVASSTSVAISFTAPSDDGGSAITNYEYSFNNSSWTALSPADATSPITISGLSGFTSYSVYLRAVNIVGSGPASSAVSFTTFAAPTTTIGSVTNFTESRGTFNATISANGSSSTVVFQYNTTNNFASYSEVSAGTVTTQSAAVSATVTGLSTGSTVNGGGVTYYVRTVATNSAGTTTSGVTSFQTWGLREYNNNVPGSYTNFSVPTVPGVVPASIPVLYLIGGGGGGGFAGSGGGAGGYVTRSNIAFSGTSGQMSLVVGGGGAGGDNASGPATNGAAGGPSYFHGTNVPFYGAGGGGGGGHTDGSGGNVGSGDNPAYTGGTTATIVSGKTTNRYCGGGAGTDGNGGNGVNGASGAGGAGNGFWGTAGGGGGGSGDGANGSPYNVGAGGHGGGVIFNGAAGAAGIVYFTYYGP